MLMKIFSNQDDVTLRLVIWSDQFSNWSEILSMSTLSASFRKIQLKLNKLSWWQVFSYCNQGFYWFPWNAYVSDAPQKTCYRWEMIEISLQTMEMVKSADRRRTDGLPSYYRLLPWSLLPRWAKKAGPKALIHSAECWQNGICKQNVNGRTQVQKPKRCGKQCTQLKLKEQFDQGLHFLPFHEVL